MKATSQTDTGVHDEALVRAAAKLRTALALYESGLALKRAQLRRSDAQATEAEIERRLVDWLRTRPGAAYGDCVGEPRVVTAD